jgi:hypothetical protein
LGARSRWAVIRELRMFEDMWRDWGRAAFAGAGGALLAAIYFLADLDEPVFAMVALLGACLVGAGLLMIEAIVQLSSGPLRLATLVFCLAFPLTGFLSTWDTLIPGPPVVEGVTKKAGDMVTWPDATGGCFLVQVKGHPGMQRGGGDARIELEILARRGGEERDLEFALFRKRSKGLNEKKGRGVDIGNRNRDLRRVVLPGPGPLSLRLVKKKPTDAAPAVLTVHTPRVPLLVPLVSAWALLALALLIGFMASRDGEMSLAPVAGIAVVVFTHLAPHHLVPSGVLLPLGGALLVSAIAGGVIGFLVNLVIEKINGRN